MAYEHTQEGMLHYILYGTSFILVFLGLKLGAEPFFSVVFYIAALFLLLLSVSCQSLTVKDEGDFLSIYSGPMALFKKKIRYSGIRSVSRSKSTILDGWGWHYRLGKGWIINVGGFDCVAIKTEKSQWRIGTDDPEGLMDFLRGKVAPPEKDHI